jgi:hypothetical protein
MTSPSSRASVRRTPRRTFVLAAFALAFVGHVAPAYAGSYLDRAALMLDEARREGDLLQPRMGDKELVGVIVTLAEARMHAAQKMEVPAAIGKAHPHLLLVLVNYQSAAEAAADGNFKKFAEHLFAARDEDRTFRALVRELGYTLPDLTSKR